MMQGDAQTTTGQQAVAAQGLVEFLAECPSMFHSVAALRARLDAAGFTYLPETASWQVEPGGSYYTTRNNSTIIAWRVGELLDSYHFQLAASHSDSPTFKVKTVPELEGAGESLRLNVESYGSIIDYSWFDRPLGLAGRALVREEGRIVSRLVDIARPVALVPSLAIHMNREVNKGFAPNRQVDLCPLFSAGALHRGALDELVASELGVEPTALLARDLYLVNLVPPTLWGAAEEPEFVSSPKLDDLMCAYVSLRAFLETRNPHDVSVFCCFDNEEVGSGTKQGAKSTVLADALSRINAALGKSAEDLRRALAASMLVSCDNAHAVHPSHPEKSDEQNRPFMNRGIVVKETARQRYCTDAFSRAVFCEICDRAGVPYQTFSNRSDMSGGSTLGNLSNAQVSLHAVDVGCAQLAMHSSYETAGARDVQPAIDALAAFYAANLLIDGSDSVEFG